MPKNQKATITPGQRMLVIHQGALGDVVLSFPALASLKRQKDASLALLCSGQAGKIAHELNVVDAHFSLESACFCSLFCEEMKPVVKEFVSDYSTVILISFSDAVENNLRQNHGDKVYRISPRPPVEEETHVALHLMRQLQEMRLLKSTGGFCSSSSKAGSISSNIDGGLPRQKGLVVMHPGAGSPRKRWAAENFIQAASIIGELHLGKVVFVVGPTESELAPFIKASSKGAFPVHEICDLSQLTPLVRQASSFIGNDSGVTHLAAFMGTPTVAVFGPSSPKRWAPVGRAIKVLRGAADCAPCFETDAVNCEDPQCLNGVSVDMVLAALKDLTMV